MSLMLASFLLACDSITPDPLVSSPDKVLTDSVAVSAQVATGEEVAYTIDVNKDIIYEIDVRRKEGSNPLVTVCEVADCELVDSKGFEFPDVNDIHDGTLKWYTSTASVAPLYIYVGDQNGDEAKYSITASTASTSTLGTVLTVDDSYGVVNTAQSAEYTLAVTVSVDIQIIAEVDNVLVGDISLRVCSESDCNTVTGTETAYTVLNPVITPTETGTLYVFVDGAANSVFHIKAITP